MARHSVICRWVIKSSLHTGSGLSQAGWADRILAKDAAGRPVLRGDAIKGALRMTLERLCRWYCNDAKEEEDESEPNNAAIRRLFAPEGARRVHFGAKLAEGSGVRAAYRSYSTAIDETGVAKTDSLRVFEYWPKGLEFEVTVTLVGEVTAEDLHLISYALVATDAIGGKRTAGSGYVKAKQPSCETFALPAPEELPATIISYLQGGAA